MVQQNGGSGQTRINDPVRRKRRKKDGLFTPPVLLLLTAVFVALVGVLLIMTSTTSFFPQEYPMPSTLNITPLHLQQFPFR